MLTPRILDHCPDACTLNIIVLLHVQSSFDYRLCKGITKIFAFYRDMYLLGYIPKDNRLYLADKELNVVSYSLLLSVLEYQTAVMRKDFDTAKEVLFCLLDML